MSKFLISRKYSEIEPNEILLDSLAQATAEANLADKRLEVPLFRLILQGFYCVCFLILLLLFGKTLYMQVAQGKEYARLAQNNQFITRKIQAERGIIYDSNLEQLVLNRSSFDLVCSKDSMPNEMLDPILSELALILNKNSASLKEEMEKANGNLTVAKDLDHQTLVLLESKINELPGCEIKNSTVRQYPDGEIFSHLLGYTGKIRADEYSANSSIYSINDFVGRDGIENVYEEYLRKKPGELKVERDALGNALSQEIVSLPQSGESIVLI